MKPLGVAVIRTGLVTPEALAELQRWGLPVDIREGAKVEMVNDLDKAVAVIRDALEGADQVRIQESDLDLLRRFLEPEHQRQGRLTVKDGKSRTTLTVPFCVGPMGEYVIPWKSEGIMDMVLEGESFLRFDENGLERTVHFIDVRESFLGNQRTFMVCTPEETNASR